MFFMALGGALSAPGTIRAQVYEAVVEQTAVANPDTVKVANGLPVDVSVIHEDGSAISAYGLGIPLDGPGLTTDSVRVAPAVPMVPMIESRGSVMMPLQYSFEDDGYETPEMRAAPLNEMAKAGVMSSIGRSIEYTRPPDWPWYVTVPLAVAGFFMGYAWGQIGGYGTKTHYWGYVPLDMSNPFISAWVPGWAPYENLSGSEFFPKAVETEFDIATGTFKQVAVDWTDYQKKLDMTQMRFRATTAVPFQPLNAVERKVFGNGPAMP